MKTRTSLILCVVAGLALAWATPAQAALLVYEPFNYTTGTPSGPTGNGVELDGQGTAGELGLTGTWHAFSNNGAITVYPEGAPSGVDYSTSGPVVLTYDGTSTKVSTSGGYVGMSATNGTDHMNYSRPLDPTVTATFTDGATTWFSFISVQGYVANPAGFKLSIGEAPTTDDARGGTSTGEAIGGGGGLGSSVRNGFKVYPQYWDQVTESPGETGGTFDNYDVTGKQIGDSTNVTALTAPYVAEGYNPADVAAVEGLQAMLIDYTDYDGPGGNNPTRTPNALNYVVGKIEWHDSDPDIISAVTFEDSDAISEAAFNALIVAQPDLCSANWVVGVPQPDLNQAAFDTLSLAGGKWFADEVRIGTTFGDVMVPEPATMALLGLGGLGLLLGRKRR